MCGINNSIKETSERNVRLIETPYTLQEPELAGSFDYSDLNDQGHDDVFGDVRNYTLTSIHR